MHCPESALRVWRFRCTTGIGRRPPPPERRPSRVGVTYLGHPPRRTAMPTYITLSSFTDQGVRNAKDSPKRAEAFKEMAKKHGVTVRDIYWTQGRYDVVTITEAPDDMAATALSLSIAGLGNVRTETLRAFSATDMQTIIGKMASS